MPAPNKRKLESPVVFQSVSDTLDAVKPVVHQGGPPKTCQLPAGQCVSVELLLKHSLQTMTSKRLRHLCTCQCLWTRPHWGTICRKTQSPLCNLQLPQKPKLRRSSPDTQLWRHQSRQRPHLFLHRSLPERRQHIHRLMRLELRPSHQMPLNNIMRVKITTIRKQVEAVIVEHQSRERTKTDERIRARTTEVANALKMVSKKYPKNL